MTFDALLVVSLAALGFTQLVRASPLGRLDYKPWSCRTCLSGWGAIFAGALGLGAVQGAALDTAAAASWALLALAGTGGAALGFALFDLASHTVVPPTDLPEPPIEGGGP